MTALLPNPDYLLILAPVVFMACFVFITVGFGGGVLAVPLAALFLEPMVILPIFGIIECFTVTRMLSMNRRHIVRGDVLRVIPASAVGTAVGIVLLVNLPVRWLMFGMSAFIACFLAARLLTRKAINPISQGWAWPFGGLAGVSSAAFGAGGPPSAIFLNMRRHDTAQTRSSIAAIGSANLLFRVTGFTLAGLYAQPAIIATAAWLLPVAYISMRLADHLRHGLSDQRILAATFAILGFSAISLFVRALAMP